MADRPAVEEDALEPAPVEEPYVTLDAHRCNGREFLLARDPAGRERSVVDEDDARAFRGRRPQSVHLEPPLTIGDVQRHETRNRSDQAHSVQHARATTVVARA